MEGYNGQDPPAVSQEAPVNPGGNTQAQQVRTERGVLGEQALYSQNNNAESDGDKAAQASQFPVAPTMDADLVPAMDFNGYVLYAPAKPVPEELVRESSGASIAPTSSVLDQENGRTYAVHETGRYFLPNDPVRLARTKAPSHAS